jgi:drug/metabolite transporter (DMT)-like permease
MTKSTLEPYGWMLCGCFSFAWMSHFGHTLGSSCDWRIIALARSFVAFTLALMLARLAGARLLLWKPGILWVRSCAGSFSLLCTFFALTRLRTSEVLTLTNTFPIWVAVLSWPLLRERPSWSVCLAAGCGVLGIVMMQQPHFDSGPDMRLATPLALTAAFSSAVAMLGLHRLAGYHPWSIVVHFSAVATLFVAAACFAGPPPDFRQAAQQQTILLLAGVGVTATIGQLCLTRAFTEGVPGRVSVVGLTQVVFGMGLDLLFETSPFSSMTLAGMALVVAPTAWVMVGKTEQ